MKKVVLGLACVAVIAGAAVYFGGASQFEKEVATEASGIKLAREVSRGGYQLISTKELQDSIAANEDMIIVDTMPYEDSYKKNHIPGAKQFLFPIPEMTEWDSAETNGKDIEAYKALLGDDLNKKIVIYCGFVKCTRSHNGAQWAVKLGYTNVLRHPGGIFAWKGAGYDVEQGG
ncbi:rhodanese-like domain-containing protein [Vibrio sp. SCSIO 43137]|uniref:rhodanese-like domain-containing protein n=1 Tax=Vibrio sp. SCSIO 43137 TaxID=3021011 RepID=UPI00230802E6|nr:rhodanese-like domain-containing protein [Vibrio sp. SCSIO 43137]WCE30825.1 rhodanese-like domain-containing protein [Vibrio sp. SCSIO 43137]